MHFKYNSFKKAFVAPLPLCIAIRSYPSLQMENRPKENRLANLLLWPKYGAK